MKAEGERGCRRRRAIPGSTCWRTILADAIAYRTKVVHHPQAGRKLSKKMLAHVLARLRADREKARDIRAGHHRDMRAAVPPPHPAQVAEMIADMLEGETGRATVSQVRRLLHRVFELARREGILHNPVTDAPAPAPERAPIATYTAEELEAQTEAAGRVGRAGDAVMVRLMGWTGLRISEAAGLKVRDFDPFSGTLTIREARKEVGGRIYTGSPKGDRSWQYPAFVRSRHARRASANGGIGGDPGRFLFTTRAGNPITPSNWRDRVWYPAAGAAQPPKPHHRGTPPCHSCGPLGSLSTY
jgi:integrase